MDIVLVSLALQFPHTVYGFGERMCGDVHQPKSCAAGALTASGEKFDPYVISAAIPMSKKTRIRTMKICFLNPKKGRKVWVKVNDKKNERYIGKGGFDFSPAAYKALTGTQATKFSSLEGLQLCS